MELYSIVSVISFSTCLRISFTRPFDFEYVFRIFFTFINEILIRTLFQFRLNPNIHVSIFIVE